MFKKNKDSEVDITSLNHILRTGKKLINIGYFMAIVCLILLGTYLIKEWKILKYIGELLSIISPIFIGFVIAWFFDPAVVWFEKKKIPRIFACILIYIFLLGVIFLISYLLVPSLVSQVKDFVTAAPIIFDNITDFVIKIIARFDANNLINVKDVKKEITSFITSFGLSLSSDLPKYVVLFGKAIISGGLNAVLGLMVGFYLLFDFNKVSKIIYSFIPKDWRDGYNVLTNRINTSLRSYVQGVLTIMLLVFITQTIGLTIAGMEAPIVFALFCAVTDVIPYFGPYIGAIPAIIVGFTISPITGVCVIISILVVQLLENNFYQPLIMGHTMKLHPVTIMVGLLVFEHFFGILGMVLATPCIACVKVIVVFISERTGFNKYFIKSDDEKIDSNKIEEKSKEIKVTKVTKA